MSISVRTRAAAVLRRENRPPGTVPARPSGDAPVPERRAHDAIGALTRRSTLRELTESLPGIRDQLINRARAAGIMVGLVAVLVVPAWTVVDRVLAPAEAGTFLLVRLLSDIPMLVAVHALWRLPVGRRQPERLTYLILFVIQAEVAWMALRVSDVSYYLLGFTVAIYVSGCVLVARPRWTVHLIAMSWGALLVSGLTADIRPDTADLIAIAIYVGTASLVAGLAHFKRFALSNQELLTRVRLEHEKERTGLLLAKLERLSHEDALTGLANRRRWDAELVEACADARQRNAVVGVVLLDIDHFKSVNDRHGHAGGDEALRQVAGLLSAGVRDGDLVARLGGDELAVLLSGADLDRAVELAERLRTEATRLCPDGFEAGELTLSLGVAIATGDRAYPMELMSQADAHLYRAKITRNAVGSSRTPLPYHRSAEHPEPAPTAS